MSLSPVAYQSHSYHVATSVFEGPLDLLLHLIERAELDITKLALAQVTDQYLEHMHRLPELMAEEVSAFLVIAAKLLLIKSEALLPRPPVREEGEEDPGEALARQLMIYRRYRKIAELLENRETNGYRSFLRLVPPTRVEGTLDLSDVSLSDLVNSAQNILFKVDDRLELKSVVSPPSDYDPAKNQFDQAKPDPDGAVHLQKYPEHANRLASRSSFPFWRFWS